jgi:surfactin synthase thioesterase subunit
VDQLQGDIRDVTRTLLPLLRADIEMLESFHQRGEEPPLDCPITVLTGQDDPLTPRESVMRWHAMTTGDFTLRRFPGRHDFPKRQSAAILSALRDLFTTEPSATV